MTVCAECEKYFEGIDRLCPDCAEEFELIASPKITGWTAGDDEKIDAALNEIGLRQSEKWTASVRLSNVNRLAIGWCMDDIMMARARIKELVSKSLDQFQE